MYDHKSHYHIMHWVTIIMQYCASKRCPFIGQLDKECSESLKGHDAADTGSWFRFFVKFSTFFLTVASLLVLQLVFVHFLLSCHLALVLMQSTAWKDSSPK